MPFGLDDHQGAPPQLPYPRPSTLAHSRYGAPASPGTTPSLSHPSSSGGFPSALPYPSRRSAALSEVLAPPHESASSGLGGGSFSLSAPDSPHRAPSSSSWGAFNSDQEFLMQVVAQMLSVAPTLLEDFVRQAETGHTFCYGLGHQLRLLAAMISQSLSYQRAFPHYTPHTQLILSLVACTPSSIFPRDAFTLFRSLQLRVFGLGTQQREEWNGCVRWSVSYVMEQMDGPPVYSYLNPEAFEYFRGVPIRGTPQQIIGKTNIELYDEAYAARYHQEDAALLQERYGLLVQSSLPFPCAARQAHCPRCCIVSTKAHLLLRDKGFLFASSSVFQCQVLPSDSHSLAIHHLADR